MVGALGRMGGGPWRLISSSSPGSHPWDSAGSGSPGDGEIYQQNNKIRMFFRLLVLFKMFMLMVVLILMLVFLILELIMFMETLLMYVFVGIVDGDRVGVNVDVDFAEVHLYVVDDGEDLVDVGHLLPHEGLQVLDLGVQPGGGG